MQRSMASAGLIGLVFLFFALVSYLTGARLYFLFNLVLGVLAIVLWATSSRETFGTLMGHRATRYGANAVVYSLGFVGLLVAINYILALHHRRFDLTSERVFSLSPQSVKVVGTLKQPLKLYGFFQGGRDPQAEALYESYTYAAPKITFQLIDPERNPEAATRYNVTRMPTTHIQYGDQGTNVGETTEQAITNGIIKVTSTSTKGACFLQGHGEPSLDDMDNAGGFGRAAQALAGENYDVKPLSLMTTPKVPSNCVVVVVAGPVKPLFPAEIDAIDGFLKNGGRALVMLRPPRPDQPNTQASLINMVSQWGLTVGDDIVLDQELHLFSGPTLGLSPIVELYPPHPISAQFNKRTLWPMVRSVEPVRKSSRACKLGLSRRPATPRSPRPRSRRSSRNRNSRPAPRIARDRSRWPTRSTPTTRSSSGAPAMGGWWSMATPISPTTKICRRFLTKTSSSTRSTGWRARAPRSRFARARCAPRASA
jgi:ABC-type uncharacterized transport system involved in gliding motility auxiliary subunit